MAKATEDEHGGARASQLFFLLMYQHLYTLSLSLVRTRGSPMVPILLASF